MAVRATAAKTHAMVLPAFNIVFYGNALTVFFIARFLNLAALRVWGFLTTFAYR